VVIGAALLLVLGVKPYVSPDSGKSVDGIRAFHYRRDLNVAASRTIICRPQDRQLVDATPWKSRWRS